MGLSRTTRFSIGDVQGFNSSRLDAYPTRQSKLEMARAVAPLIVKDTFHTISDLRQSGVAILLVEQNARAASQISDYGYVLETGAVVFEGPSRELADDSRVAETHLRGAKRPH